MNSFERNVLVGGTKGEEVVGVCFCGRSLVGVVIPSGPSPRTTGILRRTLNKRFNRVEALVRFSFRDTGFEKGTGRCHSLVENIFLRRLDRIRLIRAAVGRLLGSTNKDVPNGRTRSKTPLSSIVRKKTGPRRFVVKTGTSLPISTNNGP